MTITRKPLGDDDDSLLFDQENTITDALSEYLEGADGATGKIKVYRRPLKGDARRVEWLFDAAPDECTHSELLEKLRDDYGGGEFVVRIYSDNGTTLLATQRLSVGTPLKRAELPAQQNPLESPLFMMMREQAAQQQTMLMQLLAAIAGRPAPVQPEGLSIADAIALANQMQRNNTPPDPMQYVLQGIELGKMAAGNAPDGEDSGMMGMLKTLAPALMMAVQQPQIAPPERRIAPQPRQVAPQPRQVAPQPGHPAERQDAPAHTVSDTLYSGVAEFFASAGASVTTGAVREWHETLYPLLRAAAMKNKNPAAYTDTVIEAIGEDAVVAALQATGTMTEDEFTQLVTAYGAGNYAPWFWRLYVLIGLEFSPDAPEDTYTPEPDDTEGGALD